VTYATKQDLIDRFSQDELVQLTDTTNDPPVAIDDTRVTRALTDADSMINGYIAARYDVPVSPVPSSLVLAACSIARYMLYRDHAPDRVTNDYNNAIKWLTQVSTGTVSLTDVAAAPTPQSSGGSVMTNSPVRSFTRDSLRGL
jgi:phage gp36-like protein